MKKIILIASFCLTTGIAFTQEPFKDTNGKFGYKLNDKIIIESKFDKAYQFFEDLAIVGLNKKFGFIDKTGKEVIEIKYDLVRYFNEKICAVKFNGEWGFIDKTGKVIIPFKYDNANVFSEGMSLVTYIDKDFKTTFTYVNKDGIELPNRYRDARDFKDGLAVVDYKERVGNGLLEGEGYGVIDYSGKYIVTPKYHYMDPFENGVAFVRMRNYEYAYDMYGYIDKQGNEIIKPIYCYIEKINVGYIVKKSASYGVLDTTGKEIIPINEKYEKITYEDGYFYVKPWDYGAKVLKFDKQGNLIK